MHANHSLDLVRLRHQDLRAVAPAPRRARRDRATGAAASTVTDATPVTSRMTALVRSWHERARRAPGAPRPADTGPVAG